MSNPFEVLENRLSEIENLIMGLKVQPEKQADEPEKPIGVKEAAEFLNLKPATVYTKVSNEQLPFIRRGGKLYFFKSTLSEYLNGSK